MSFPPPSPSSSSPSPSTSFDAFQAALQSAAITATKASMRLPAPKDIPYHRSLNRQFGKQLDACSERILDITSRLLDYAKDVDGTSTHAQGKGKRRLEGEDDVVDRFRSLVVDVLDQLLERTDAHLDEFLGRTKPPAIPINPQRFKPAIKAPRGRLDPVIMHASHLPKPQILFRTPVDNKNVATPWRPTLKTKPHALIPLNDPRSSPHPYHYEISHYTPPSHLLTPPQTPITPSPLPSSSPTDDPIPLNYITRASQLPSLLAALSAASEFAVDLEHHSYRSYAGFVCLMQISTRDQDWIVDCLEPEVREAVEGGLLNDVFADPGIVKVFHGAESDIIWLQQNFNTYVVGLFDTYHATKVLDFPSHSLSSLLEMFCDFTPDKRFQLADWRIRPLPNDMLRYARADTHFLLYVYDVLRGALIGRSVGVDEKQSLSTERGMGMGTEKTTAESTKSGSPALLEVLHRSAGTSLRTYTRETYDTGTAWETIVKKWNRSMYLGNEVQARVFRAVHEWRDGVAREEDESVRYVLPNHHLFTLASRPSVDVPTLLSVLQPTPPLVRARAAELVSIVREAVGSDHGGDQGEAKNGNEGAGSGEDMEGENEDAVVTVPAGVVTEARVVGTLKSTPLEVGESLWNRIKPARSACLAASSTLLGSKPKSSAQLPPPVYSAACSTLFGPPFNTSHAGAHAHAKLIACIHGTLVLAPSLTDPSSGDTTPPSLNPAATVEIAYVPASQRRTLLCSQPQATSGSQPQTQNATPSPNADSNATTGNDHDANDNIVIVGQRQKKRKRKAITMVSKSVSEEGSSGSKSKKRKSESEGCADDIKDKMETQPFDFASAPNILDEPEAVAAPARRRREKGAKATMKYGDFPAPPRNMSEVKSGNQARTFR